MMRGLTTLAGGLALAALAGCSFLPTWQAPAGVKTAVVNLPARGAKSACVGDTAWHLEPDAQGNVSLPVDERVTLWASYTWSSGNISYSCNPGTSFVPQEGNRYAMVFEIEPEIHGCTYQPYRQTTANRIGLDFEPTLGRPQSCSKH